MPYIKQERRPDLDKVVDELVNAVLKKGDIELFLLNIANFSNVNYWFERRIKRAVEESYKVDVKPNGDINYILFKYCKYNVKPSYNNYKSFMGEIYAAMASMKQQGEFKNEFRESAEWIRIKILTPYEEKAIEKNGDV
ncbi:hypothetical protein LCGC14_1296080 [marine sediment metagenome]|uniref:Uncharacterized protein n=1 Tax=marine sediment metagenome TaxID=412755 RepID=A0A0F9N7H3_9ZZZZ